MGATKREWRRKKSRCASKSALSARLVVVNIVLVKASVDSVETRIESLDRHRLPEGLGWMVVRT
jgi:hypothetical protein